MEKPAGWRVFLFGPKYSVAPERAVPAKASVELP